jgi:hypothetical protein
MPDDPNRDHHEKNLERLIAEWQNSLGVELLYMVDSGYTPESIPKYVWAGMKDRLKRNIQPHLQLIMYQSDARLSKQLAERVNVVDQVVTATDESEKLAENYAEWLITAIKENLIREVNAARDDDLALASIILILLSNQYRPKRDAVSMVTDSISQSEYVVANRIEQYLNEPYQSRDIVDEIGPPERRYRVVAIWVKEDENACKICTGLHGKMEDDWPPEYAGGPKAHPS